ncbi:nuclear transport factor 2 family protein [Mycobacterium talmoniae]|nr:MULTISPECIES: nuclear transport factor 2 family protein [Mycobacterium]TDH49544.1 nuclear transport factor 2 family protein [Mycobacterium eburneum]
MTTPLATPAAAFVERFRQVWAAPTLERLDALTNPEVCYVQPLLPDVRGRDNAAAYWRRVFALIPDLHIDVVNSAVSADDMVYIEFRIHGTLGGRALSWPAIDRYELDEAGRVRRRVLYCDSLTMVRAVLRPRALMAVLRTGIRLGVAAAAAKVR